MARHASSSQTIQRLKRSAAGGAAKALLRECRTLLHARTLLAQPRVPAAAPNLSGLRHITRFSVPSDAGLGEAARFTHWIAPNTRLPEGVDAFYLPPHTWRSSNLAFLTNRYPASSGLKISKNIGDVYSHYMTPRSGRHIQRHLSGSHLDQVVTYNHLYLEGIAPRLWDIAELVDAAGHVRVAYVVDHVAGSAPAPDEFADVVGRLKTLCRETQAVLVSGSGWRGVDFQLPDGNGNVITSDLDGRPRYVDIHSFKMTGQPYGLAEPGTQSGGLGADEPVEFHAFLNQQGLSLNGKLLVDLRPTDARLAVSCLRRGARWVHAVVPNHRSADLTRDLMVAGETCFSTSGTGSGRGAVLPHHLANFRASEVLIRTTEEAALTASNLLETVAWRYMVFEQGGHENRAPRQPRGSQLRLLGASSEQNGYGRLTLWERCSS